MNILITNDDGIYSDGIIRLATIAKEYGNVWVIAPDSQRSGMSHMVTMRGSVELRKVDFPVTDVNAFSCNGSPSDCIKIGILKALTHVDFVLSGINNNYNITADLQYSATIGAALEASFLKVPAIAFSEGNPNNHAVADFYIKEIIEKLMRDFPGKNTVWNVNFPDCALSECKGIKYDCTVSTDDFYQEKYDEKIISENVKSYTLGFDRNWKGTEGTDLHAIIENYVAVSKVHNLN